MSMEARGTSLTIGVSFEDYVNQLKAELNAKKTLEGASDSEAFLQIMTSKMYEAGHLMDEVNSRFYTGVNRRRQQICVDGILIEDDCVNLFIVDKEDGTYTDRFVAEACNRLTSQLVNLMNGIVDGTLINAPNIDMSSDIYSDIELIMNMVEHRNLARIRLYILTFRNAEGGLRKYSQKYDSIAGIPVERQVWDIARIYSIESSQGDRQEIEIDFRDFDCDGIPCIRASGVQNQDFRSYLCIIPGTVLADIYDRYGSLLLEGNVRSFLSTKVSVNKNIRATIANSPERFFAYNNGISTTANSLEFVSGDDGLKLVKVKGLQIINGGQTTASLSNSRFKDKRDLRGIYVQMKMTEILNEDNAEVAELIRMISRSSNSQSKVSDADFFSVHPFHVEMERLSERCLAPATASVPFETHWFYERARGQYLQKQMRMTKGQQDIFLRKNPKNQLVTKTDFAKFRNTWDGIPHIVSKGAQTNFLKFSEVICGKDGSNEWGSVAANYNELYFKETMMIGLIFRKLEAEVSKQAWYTGAYRANIVTYTIALFADLLKNSFSDSSFSPSLLWEKQAVPDPVVGELLKLAKVVYNHICDTDKNVTQWCKQEKCWTLLKQKARQSDLRIALAAFEDSSLLQSRLDRQRDMRDAKVRGELQVGVDALTAVMGYSGWRRLWEFVEERMNISSFDMQALRKVVAFVEGRGMRSLPTEKQAKSLLKLKERALGEGFLEKLDC